MTELKRKFQQKVFKLMEEADDILVVANVKGAKDGPILMANGGKESLSTLIAMALSSCPEMLEEDRDDFISLALAKAVAMTPVEAELHSSDTPTKYEKGGRFLN